MPRAFARAFVRHIINRPSISETDLSHSLQLIREQPSVLKRVVDLARAVADLEPQSLVLLRWLEQVVRSQDEALREWGRDPAKSAVATLEELTAWATLRIREKGHAARRQEAERLLQIGLNVLLAGRDLTASDTLRAIGQSITRGKSSRHASPDRSARKLVSRAGMKQLLDLARIAALSDAKLLAVEEAQHRAILQAGRLSREKETLEASHAIHVTKIEELKQQLSERDEQLKQLAADVESTRKRGLQHVHGLNSRFRRIIGEGLAGLLADAWDAIDTDPPHPNVARERIASARETIRSEMEWLDKSSD